MGVGTGKGMRTRKSFPRTPLHYSWILPLSCCCFKDRYHDFSLVVLFGWNLYANTIHNSTRTKFDQTARTKSANCVGI